MLFIIWTICCVPAASQLPDYQLSRITEQEALKTSDLRNIIIDNDGFMWLSTQSMVQRFDGRHTMKFSFSETVEAVYADNQNRKWVITRKGIFLFINQYAGFKEIKCLPAVNSPIVKIFERNTKDVLLLRYNGAYVYSPVKQVFDLMPLKNMASLKPFTNLLISNGREYWFNRDSIVLFDTNGVRLNAVAFRSKLHTAVIGKETLLVSTTSFRTWNINITNGTASLLSIPGTGINKKDNNFIIYSNVPLDNNNYLLGTNKGLLQYNANTNTLTLPVFYFNGQLLENQQPVKDLYRDKQGTIFISHPDGLFQLFKSGHSMQYIRNYEFRGERMPSSDVRNFSEDEMGDIWMATTNGITKLNMKSGALTVYPLADSNNPVQYPSYRQLLSDGPYTWIGSSGKGVWVHDRRTGKFIRPIPGTDSLKNDFENTYVWKIIKLANGKIFVAGGGRCYLIDPVTLLYKPAKFSSSAKSSRSAMQDSSGRIWHGTSTGLTCMDSMFQTLFTVHDSIPDVRVAALCEWKKDYVLIGTKGLYEVRLSGNRPVSFQRKMGIPAERFIYCMKQDKQGIVWLGTDDGIFRYDPAKDKSDYFDKSDYVQTHAFNSDAAFLSRTGIMFMGGINGINYFNPETVMHEHQPLLTQISSFETRAGDSSWVRVEPPYKIAYENRDIDFIISAPEFKNPFAIQYRYKLRSKDSAWISNGYNDRVRINHLEPGDYALQVSASMDGITWVNASKLLSFTVLKPWWNSWPARIFYLAAAITSIWMYRRYKMRRLEAKQIEQAKNYFALSGNQDSNTSDILWDIARNCISRLGFEDCVIYLLDEHSNRLVQKAAYGPKSPVDFTIANPIEIPVGKGITGLVAETGKSILIKNTGEDNRYIVDDKQRNSELAVPILHEGKVIGVIDSEHSRRNFFKIRHQQTLEEIAGICSSKIAKAIAVEAMKKAEGQLDQLNGKILETKFMNLRLQMNPHFLFNTLTSIQYLIVSGQTTKAINYLNVFSKFLRSLLSYAEDTLVTLEDEIRILKMYIDLESLSLDETFVYNICVDENIEQEEVFVPFMVLQPFVENAIHHGLMPRIGEKRFTINVLEIDEEQMECTIEDNGVGRQTAAEIKLKKMRAARHESKGVSIVEQRLELLGQKTGKTGSIKYEDLFDEDGKPAGTRVNIIIPFYNTIEL